MSNKVEKDEKMEPVEEEHDITAHEDVKMRKELGLFEGVVIIITIVLGSGIFIAPQEVFKDIGSAWGAITIWVACGFQSLLGSLCYAELGTAIPKEGGDYCYIGMIYGQLPAFLYLWIAITVSIPCTNAIMSLSFANYILYQLFPGCPINDIARKLVAAAILCLMTFFNAYNVRVTAKIQNILGIMMIISTLIINIGGIRWIALGNFDNLKNGWEGTSTSLGGWSIAFYSGTFAYCGWNYLNFMVGELKDPYINLPRAIYIALAIVIFIYVSTNLSFLAVLSPEKILQTEAIGVDFSIIALGPIKHLMPTLIAGSTLGGLSTHIMTSSRICFVGAQNAQMPQILGQINMRCMTPMPCLIFLLFLSLIMLLITNISFLITFCTIAECIFFMLSCAAVILLRHKYPNMERPVKINILAPIIYVTLSGLSLLAPITYKPRAVIAAIFAVLSGLPIYVIFIKNRPKFLDRFTGKYTIFCQKLFYSVNED